MFKNMPHPVDVACFFHNERFNFLFFSTLFLTLQNRSGQTS
jgi:hypothetical protein